MLHIITKWHNPKQSNLENSEWCDVVDVDLRQRKSSMVGLRQYGVDDDILFILVTKIHNHGY